MLEALRSSFSRGWNEAAVGTSTPEPSAMLSVVSLLLLHPPLPVAGRTLGQSPPSEVITSLLQTTDLGTAAMRVTTVSRTPSCELAQSLLRHFREPHDHKGCLRVSPVSLLCASLFPTPGLGTTSWWLEIGRDGSIYTTVMGKGYKLNSSPQPSENWFIGIPLHGPQPFLSVAVT